MINNIDFQEVLCDFVNSLNLPLEARLDYFTEKDDLVINLISGGRVEQLFMDSTQEISLPFEIAVKSLENKKANAIMWTIHSALSEFNLQLPSNNGTYQFLSLDVGKPAVNGRDEQDYFIYTLRIVAKLEIEGDLLNG
jgi:minor capsid protein|nr:MAG TPA: Minor capsid protein [Caudoviricetes sp.]